MCELRRIVILVCIGLFLSIELSAGSERNSYSEQEKDMENFCDIAELLLAKLHVERDIQYFKETQSPTWLFEFLYEKSYRSVAVLSISELGDSANVQVIAKVLDSSLDEFDRETNAEIQGERRLFQENSVRAIEKLLNREMLDEERVFRKRSADGVLLEDARKEVESFIEEVSDYPLSSSEGGNLRDSDSTLELVLSRDPEKAAQDCGFVEVTSAFEQISNPAVRSQRAVLWRDFLKLLQGKQMDIWLSAILVKDGFNFDVLQALAGIASPRAVPTMLRVLDDSRKQSPKEIAEASNLMDFQKFSIRAVEKMLEEEMLDETSITTGDYGRECFALIHHFAGKAHAKWENIYGNMWPITGHAYDGDGVLLSHEYEKGLTTTNLVESLDLLYPASDSRIACKKLLIKAVEDWLGEKELIDEEKVFSTVDDTGKLEPIAYQALQSFKQQATKMIKAKADELNVTSK